MHRLERIEALELDGTELAANALERCRLAHDAGVAPVA